MAEIKQEKHEVAVQEREKRLAAAEAEASLHRDLQNYARELSEAKVALTRLAEDSKIELASSAATSQSQLQVCASSHQLPATGVLRATAAGFPTFLASGACTKDS